MPEILRSRFDHRVAMGIAATEYRRVISTLEGSSPADWGRSTECPGWDVRAMAGHMLGMAEYAASFTQLVRQTVLSTRRAGRDRIEEIDALTALQVQDHARLGPAELIERLRKMAPRAVRGRSRIPQFLQSRVTLTQEYDDVEERWTLGYLFGSILTRDPFMHRIDIARATGVQVPATTDHEGVIVADVVAEWGARHGQPYRLDLTGEAGGHWTEGEGGVHLEMEAIEFCRLLSGRGEGTDLMARHVPF